MDKTINKIYKLNKNQKNIAYNNNYNIDLLNK